MSIKKAVSVESCSMNDKLMIRVPRQVGAIFRGLSKGADPRLNLDLEGLDDLQTGDRGPYDEGHQLPIHNEITSLRDGERVPQDAPIFSVFSEESKPSPSLTTQRRWRHWFPRRSVFFLFIALGLTHLILLKWRHEQALALPWRPGAETHSFGLQLLDAPRGHLDISNYELPLRTRGRNIVDARGDRFKLASINWYGASDELFVVGGLNIQNRSAIAQAVKHLGFNSVRLPYADELVRSNPRVSAHLLSANPDLVGLGALDIFHAVVDSLTEANIAVIINNHMTSATRCCGVDPCNAGWANDHLGPLCRVSQTEEDWIGNWEKMMEPHVGNPLVIGADLRNEVRGLWGTMPWARWAAAAERCGNRLLQMNRDWLVVVEGTESANDLSSARRRPIKLNVENRLVYSAHVYGWSGWASLGGRFVQRSYESSVRAMRRGWGYLLEEDIAPVWIGELGASHAPTVGGKNYWDNLFGYLKFVDADFGYWALNPRQTWNNARESYSLVGDDYATPIVDYRMQDILELMGGP